MNTASAAPLLSGVLIPVSLDTKAEAVRHLCEQLCSHGLVPIVADCGILGSPQLVADITREELAERAGANIASLKQAGDRAVAIPAMIRGLEHLVSQMLAEGRLLGCLGIGGGTNAAFAAAAFELMPFGMPKMLVSTIASGNTTSFVQGNDVVLYHSVVDVLGLNSILRVVLDKAAAAMAAMVRQPMSAPEEQRSTTIGMTVFGSTTVAAMRAEETLGAKGYDVLPFHARGVGGRAMESLVRDGRIHAVLDLTTTEIADELTGGILSAGPNRLEAAGLAGVPQVILPGSIDMVNFGPAASVPAQFARRRLLAHSPHATLMRTSAEENQAIARFMAHKLNTAKGPVEVVIPTQGYSAYDREGQPFYDPEADLIFRESLVATLHPDIAVHLLDLHINDHACADFAVERLLVLLEGQASTRKRP